MFSWIYNVIRSIVDRILSYLLWPRKAITEFTLPVHIKTSGGRTILMQLNPKWTVEDIKKFVAPKIGMKAEECSIIFAGKSLSDSLLLEV